MIGEILPEAIAVAISPTRIMAIVLLLSTPRGTSNASSFLLGWIIGLVGVGTISYIISEPAAYTNEGPAIWVGWLYLTLGVVAVGEGLRRFVGSKKHDEEASIPAWSNAVDRITAPRALATGFAWVALNPKNAALSLAAATAVAAAGLSRTGSIGAYGVFVVIATLGLIVPIAMHVIAGDRANEALAEFRGWLARNNAGITAVVLLVIGTLLLGSGLDVLLA